MGSAEQTLQRITMVPLAVQIWRAGALPVTEVQGRTPATVGCVARLAPCSQ
jgi:hypothetical protein